MLVILALAQIAFGSHVSFTTFNVAQRHEDTYLASTRWTNLLATLPSHNADYLCLQGVEGQAKQTALVNALVGAGKPYSSYVGSPANYLLMDSPPCWPEIDDMAAGISAALASSLCNTNAAKFVICLDPDSAPGFTGEIPCNQCLRDQIFLQTGSITQTVIDDALDYCQSVTDELYGASDTMIFSKVEINADYMDACTYQHFRGVGWTQAEVTDPHLGLFEMICLDSARETQAWPNPLHTTGGFPTRTWDEYYQYHWDPAISWWWGMSNNFLCMGTFNGGPGHHDTQLAATASTWGFTRATTSANCTWCPSENTAIPSSPYLADDYLLDHFFFKGTNIGNAVNHPKTVVRVLDSLVNGNYLSPYFGLQLQIGY